MAYDLSRLSMVQLDRLYRKVWDRMTRGDGYQPFGYDWSTLWAVHPGYCEVIASVKTHANRLLHS